MPEIALAIYKAELLQLGYRPRHNERLLPSWRSAVLLRQPRNIEAKAKKHTAIFLILPTTRPISLGDTHPIRDYL